VDICRNVNIEFILIHELEHNLHTVKLGHQTVNPATN